MSPTLALLIWIVLLAWLLRFDPAKSKLSPALWIPVIWLFISASRSPAQWFNGVNGTISLQSIEVGNPLDRVVDLALSLSAFGVLVLRSFNWGQFFRRNAALAAYIGFALVSVCWSDFPLVALKRWFRDLDAYFIVLVVLTDRRPAEALKWVLRRLCYFAVPLSIVLDKYFPALSRSFDSWTGIGTYAGITTGKNMLGCLALISGIFFFWEALDRWGHRQQPKMKAALIVDTLFLLMSLDLLRTAQSTTAKICFGLGCFAVAAVHSKTLQRRPRMLKVVFPAMIVTYLVLAFGMGMNSSLAELVGKNSTLTDRTRIWAFLLSMHTNPIVGTGYESFWMGSRLQWFWSNAGLGHINEAHNGFLEVYLQLGVVGVLLISWLVISGYRNICKRLSSFSTGAPFAFAVWIVVLFYAETEAAFRSGTMWVLLLFVCLYVPQRAGRRRKAPLPVMNGSRPELLDEQPELAFRSDFGSLMGEHITAR